MSQSNFCTRFIVGIAMSFFALHAEGASIQPLPQSDEAEQEVIILPTQTEEGLHPVEVNFRMTTISHCLLTPQEI